MNWTETVNKLHALGYSVTFSEDQIRYSHRGDSVPDHAQAKELLSALLDQKDEIRRQVAIGTELTLEGFKNSRLAMRIYSEVLNREIWLVPTEAEGKKLIGSELWFSAEELGQLLKLRIRPEDLKRLVAIKEIFKGSKIIEGRTEPGKFLPTSSSSEGESLKPPPEGEGPQPATKE